jgi:hypothetical protein
MGSQLASENQPPAIVALAEFAKIILWSYEEQ